MADHLSSKLDGAAHAQLNDFMNWFVEVFGGFFRAVSDCWSGRSRAFRRCCTGCHGRWSLWSAAMAAHAASGWRLAAFTVLRMILHGGGRLLARKHELSFTGGHFRPRRRSSRLCHRCLGLFLDPCRTGHHADASTCCRPYRPSPICCPILLLFGFGTVVGLIASVLYAFPPMVRNTILGLRRVPAEVIESGLMSGATQRQLFWLVQVPTALRQILLGVNQTTMASLSMVIIASIIGGTADIGWEVLSTMRKAQFGESVLAGIVIALIAMVMDRITAGLATRDSAELSADVGFAERYRYWLIAPDRSIVLILAAQVIPVLKDYPESWEYYPADGMNEALNYVILNYREVHRIHQDVLVLLHHAADPCRA